MSKHILNMDDCMSIEILQDLSNKFVAAGIAPLDLSAGINLLPTAAFINIIERNLDTLAGANPPPGMKPTKTWLGGVQDNPWLSYKDVNRWFASLDAVLEG